RTGYARWCADAVDLWRQDHDLSPPRRGGAGAAVALSAERQGTRGLDRQVGAARWRSRRLGAAGAISGTAAQLSLPVAGACQPPRACLWHTRDETIGQREVAGRPRRMLRRHADGVRSQLSDGVGM